MTETSHLQTLLNDLLNTEKSITGLQSQLKTLVQGETDLKELAEIVEKRQKTMVKLGELDQEIEKELENTGPGEKAQANVVLQQVGNRLQTLTLGEQELLAAVENQLNGATKVHTMEKQAKKAGGKLDISQ